MSQLGVPCLILHQIVGILCSMSKCFIIYMGLRQWEMRINFGLLSVDVERHDHRASQWMYPWASSGVAILYDFHLLSAYLQLARMPSLPE